MSDNPFFSIIIPVYNRAEMVSQTFQSRSSARTFADFEVLLPSMTDSSDQSREVLMKSIAEYGYSNSS